MGKPKKIAEYKAEVHAACFDPGCGWSRKGRRARAAGLRHGQATGHPVAVRTITMEAFGAAWAAVVARIPEDVSEFTRRDLEGAR